MLKLLRIIFFWTLISETVLGSNQMFEKLAPDVQAGLSSNIISPVQPHLVFNTKDQADAWLNDMSHRLKPWVGDDFLRTHYLTTIQYEASRAGLDPQLVLSIITVESRFNKYAVSGKGARGMMQVMPFWQAQIGTLSQNLFDTETNIRYGCTILRYYLQLENGNMDRALERYNGSIGQTWYPEAVYNAYAQYWQPYPVMEIKNGKLVSIDYTIN